MHHHWQVRRQVQPHEGAACRWDRAYCLLLEWTALWARGDGHGAV